MQNSITQEAVLPKPAKQSNVIPLIIIGVLFFLFGFVTWTNSTLMPYLKIACQLTNSQVILVTLAFYISYAVTAFPCSWVLGKTGLKKGMVLGLLIMAVGALIFIPAAKTRTFPLFLCGLFVIGTGLSLLQTASNPYATILGPIESAAKRISIMGICNKVAGALAPLILGAIILKDIDALQARLATMDAVAKEAELNTLASTVIFPYVVIAVVLVVLSVGVYFSKLPEITPDDEAAANDTVVHRSSVFKYPYLWLGFVALFLYVGVEVISGDVIQLYANTLGIKVSEAKNFTTYTMLSMLAGYIIGITAMPKFINQAKALMVSAIIAVLFTLVVIFSTGYTSVLFLALLGLANALMWPAIWPLSIGGLGKFTNFGAALLIVGIAGGALIPKLWTMLGSYLHTDKAFAEANAYQNAFWIMIPCYLFILFFAVKGNKVGKSI
ncbi:MAG TPA: sugar MFS transporter [Chitinophagaceae bacterium]|nr:sugar MFS transporter [Chitinophagaceae bacterium]